jgi:5'-3' exonuclease
MAIDAASMYFRAFHSVPDSVVAPDGTPVNAIRGYLDATASLIRRFAPDAMVAALDLDWRPAWRVELLPTYKAHRVAADPVEAGAGAEEVPDLLEPQVPILLDVLEALGIAAIGAVGYEADDVLGTLATGAGGPVDVVTGDRDLFQLVDDEANVRVLYTAKGYAKLDVVDEGWVLARYGVPARAYADFAALRGDPSDGLPGVKGIGDKTAATLVARFGGVPGIVSALDDPAIELPRRASLEDARPYLAAALPVVRVARDLKLPDHDETLPSSPADPERLTTLATRWGIESPVARLVEALASNA